MRLTVAGSMKRARASPCSWRRRREVIERTPAALGQSPLKVRGTSTHLRRPAEWSGGGTRARGKAIRGIANRIMRLAHAQANLREAPGPLFPGRRRQLVEENQLENGQKNHKEQQHT